VAFMKKSHPFQVWSGNGGTINRAFDPLMRLAGS
jgi:hypothetical protein